MLEIPIEETFETTGANAVRALSAFAARGYSSAREATQAIFGLIHQLVRVRVCVLTRVDLATDTLTVVVASDRAGIGVTSGMVLPASHMPCACVVKRASALHEFDLAAHPVFGRLPICTQMGLRAYVGVPLRRSDGTIWGTLAAADPRPMEMSEAHLQTLLVLARLAVLEFEGEEQREALARQAKSLGERLAMVEALEEERLRAARVQAVLEAAVTVSHEVNNPLTVLTLRLGRLIKRLPEAEADDLEVALEAAREISLVTMRLRNVVRLVSTEYLAGDTRMIDLAASAAPGE
jgi:hypothetical protein